MKITNISTFLCDAGWRPWIFLKLETDEGIIGWSEITDSHGSPLGLQGIVENLKDILIGRDPREILEIYWDMYRATRQTPGGLIQKAMAGIENACWDVKAKALGVPVYQLLGGRLRDRLPVYWSHCATTRVRAHDIVNQPAIKTYDDLMGFCTNVVLPSGYTAIKTNILLLGDEQEVYMPGFHGPLGSTSRNPETRALKGIETLLGTLRDGLGPDFRICLDLNFNFNMEGCLKVAKIAEQFDLFWLEIDNFDANSLAKVRESTTVSISSGENLYGARQFLPFITNYSMNVGIIDVVWNGIIESQRIADLADIHEMNVAPHNYYSHLSTLISAQFCATRPNFKIMEVDVDDVPWREELTTYGPEIENGEMILSDRPGWGADVNEDVIKAHPWTK